MDPQEALADLKQISVQIVHAVVADHGGSVLGSTLPDDGSAGRLSRTARELWEAADGARRELGRDELAQLEVATPEGSVFLVRDPARLIAATTSADPTVGLVFYDLKACLRSIAEQDGSPEPAAEPPPVVPDVAPELEANRETPAPLMSEGETATASAPEEPADAATVEPQTVQAVEEENRGEA